MSPPGARPRRALILAIDPEVPTTLYAADAVRVLKIDLERSGLTERAKFWPLPGLSSSVVVVVTS